MIDTRVIGIKRQFMILILFMSLAITLEKQSLIIRRHVASRGFLPRCRYDESILKNDLLFKDIVANAHIVFTGKITSEIILKNHSMEFGVTVRRYFKNLLDFPRNVEIRLSKTLNDGEGVRCRQLVRIKYTAIFIGRKPERLQNVDIALSLAPLPVTLNNLDRVSLATKGKFLCNNHCRMLLYSI